MTTTRSDLPCRTARSRIGAEDDAGEVFERARVLARAGHALMLLAPCVPFDPRRQRLPSPGGSNRAYSSASRSSYQGRSSLTAHLPLIEY